MAGLLLTTGRASHPGRQRHHQKAQNTTDTAGRHRGYCYPHAPFTHSSIGGDDGGASTSSVHGIGMAPRRPRGSHVREWDAGSLAARAGAGGSSGAHGRIDAATTGQWLLGWTDAARLDRPLLAPLLPAAARRRIDSGGVGSCRSTTARRKASGRAAVLRASLIWGGTRPTAPLARCLSLSGL